MVQERGGWPFFVLKIENSMVINTSEEAIEVHYAKCVGQSLKWFVLVKNDRLCNQNWYYWCLTYPILKCGVYEFFEDVNVDILWYT